MKKLIALLLILAMSLALFACSDGGNTPDDGGSTPDDGGSTPDDGGSTPDDGGNTPDDGGNTPDDGGNEDGNRINYKELLKALINGYRIDPFENIPEAMLPGGSDISISGDIPSDYSSFVSLSDITYGGYGEQWNMVITNLNQSRIFFTALDVIDSIAVSSVAVFETFIDENPADTAHHSFMNGIYSVTIDCSPDRIYFVVEYTADFPLLGEQTVQLALSMDVLTGAKSVRVQIGDANALAYVIKDGGYDFAIKYLGVRRAFFSIQNDDSGNAAGHIYEYIVVSGVEIASCADFYITPNYVAAVGNKANGIPLFDNYICELYDSDSGMLLGYEVRESKSAITFDTLWFNLSDVLGIESIRYTEQTEDEDAAIYINGSSTAFETTKYGGIGGKMLSRRYDIEFRTQYYYVYNEESGEYDQISASVPMLFVQEEKLSDFETDVEKANGIELSVVTSADVLDELMAVYDASVDIFIENKDAVTPDIIVELIGDRISFEE